MFEKVVQRGTHVVVAVLIVCVLGTVAALRIPVQMIPDLDVRVISVRTVWPGATPQDIEKEILVEQEDYLRNLPNLSRIVSTARSGRAEIELEFPFGTDITEMLIRVTNALSQVQSYPENVDEPQVFANSFSSNAFMFYSVMPLPGNPRNLDMDLMLDFVEDNIKLRMSSIAGVSEVWVRGSAERQIQVHIDPAKLAQRNLSVNDVREAIRNRNRDRSGGELVSGKRQYLLRTIGRFDSLEDLEQLVLARRGDSITRLADVADVFLDHSEKQDFSSYNGQPNIFMAIRKESGANVIDIKRAMQKEVVAINREVLEPAGLKVSPVADDVRYVEESIRNVAQNLLIGALLATTVMFLFLRSFRATVIGVMGIPVCIIAAFLGLLLAGRTINVISLAGIAFAIGMTLDNSIVVLESIELARRKTTNAVAAAIEGVRQVWPAVLASTLTTVMVFLPVAFVELEVGQLYSDIAIAISFAILASMLVAITVLPTAAARLKIGGGQSFDAGARSSGGRMRKATLAMVASVVATKTRRISCIAVTVTTSFAIIIGLTPDAEYLPEGEEPKLFASMNAPPGYSLESMQEIAAELQNYFTPFIGDDPTRFHRKETAVPAFAYMNMRVTAEQIRIIAEPADPGDIELLMDAITQKYKTFPGMRAFAARGSIITSNDGGTRSINLDISGPDLAGIYNVATSAYRRAEAVFGNPRIQSSPPSLALAQPMVEVHPHWDRAAELGLNADTLGYTVAALTDGIYADEFFFSDDKLDIYLYSDAGQNASLDGIAQLPIYTPNGGILPLSALADIVETVDSSSIRRVAGRRTVTLNIIPPRDVALETGVVIAKRDIVQHMRDNGQIPLNVQVSISGAADQLDATREVLAGNYMVAVIIIYLLLVAIFNHWGYPLLIITSIPLGIAGGIIGLWLMNAVGSGLPLIGVSAIRQPFDMISMLGFLILMGTVVNNPILIVDRAVSNVRAAGMNALEAVNEAVEARLRPIAMSTITTIFGLAPLVLIPGAGTELYRGVG
ncbi:MAG: efflux RND transporter permease subunit, partial [Pseudomonadales bacterium]